MSSGLKNCPDCKSELLPNGFCPRCAAPEDLLARVQRQVAARRREPRKRLFGWAGRKMRQAYAEKQQHLAEQALPPGDRAETV